MLLPPYLKKGDKIGLIATARKVTPAEMEYGINILEQWGLKVVKGKNLFKQYHQFAGTDAQRSADLQAMLDDTTIKAIICARGGYGTVKIIDEVDFKKFRKHPKWVIGYSDITVLHAHINRFGIASLHATMPINFNKNNEAVETLRKALFGKKNEYHYQPTVHGRTGTVSGELVGGNLSLLYALNGTPSDIDTKGKILFIEDLDEQLYHIDRMMVTLKRAGKLKYLKGLIVGGMTEMKEGTVPYGQTAEQIIMDAVKAYQYPVCFQFPAGHIEQNLALVLGKKVKLEVTKNRVKLS